MEEFDFIEKRTAAKIRKAKMRVGDIVEIKNDGCRYSTYSKAFKYFTKKERYIPYYSYNDAPKGLEFKIIKMAVHESTNEIVCYLKDREHKDIVIGLSGLRLIKQFPLRKDETTNVEIERIH